MFLQQIYSLRLDLLAFALMAVLAATLVNLWLRSRDSRLPRMTLALGSMLLVAGLALAETEGSREGGRLGSTLEGVARAYAAETELLGHWRLAATPPGPADDDPLYRRLLEAQARWVRHNRIVSDIYTVRPGQDGKVYFLVDAATDYDRDGGIDSPREDRVPPGTEMTVYDSGLRRAIGGWANFSSEVISDAWGVWVGAWAPLRAPDGRVEGALGVDFPARDWILAVLRVRVQVMSWTGVILSILCGASAAHALALVEGRQRREAEEVRRESEEEMATLADAAGSPILWIDVDGTIRRCNRAGERVLGLSRRSLAGRRFQEFLSPSDAVTAFEQALASVRTYQGTLSAEAELAVEGGDRRAYLWTIAGIPGDVGAAAGMILVGYDVTLEREASAALRAARDAAEWASREKSRFLANVSHELRTPLTAILGFSDLMSEPNLEPEERMRALEIIRRNGDHLMHLVNDLLDSSRIEAGRMEVVEVPCSPFEIIHDVVESCRVRARTRGLTLEVRYLTPLPEQIETDPMRVRQVLMNLVANAIKFTDSGSVTLEVSLVRDDVPYQLLQVDVIDTGIGIPESEIGSLFLPFRQVDSSSARRHGGSGIGLLISLRLAQLLGGTVELVESRESGGSRFRAKFGVGRLEEVPLVDAESVQSVGAKRVRVAERPVSGRVLLAEDGVDNRELIARILRRAGAEVEAVGDGRQAVDRAQAALDEGRPFDWILMDMQMPVMDGYEATRELRARGYSGCIIALTAHAMEEDRQRCLRAGCDDYASKPVDRGALTAMLNAHRTVGD